MLTDPTWKAVIQNRVYLGEEGGFSSPLIAVVPPPPPLSKPGIVQLKVYMCVLLLEEGTHVRSSFITSCVDCT